MGGGDEQLDRLLARWVLGQVTPEAVVAEALGAVAAGCSHPSVAVVAGSKATTRGEIEPELMRLLRDLRKPVPAPEQALKSLVDGYASAIVRGDLDPVRGASEIFQLWANEDESEAFLSQVRAFVDLVSDDVEHFPGLDVRRAEIVAEAQRFVAGGGLRLPL